MRCVETESKLEYLKTKNDGWKVERERKSEIGG